MPRVVSEEETLWAAALYLRRACNEVVEAAIVLHERPSPTMIEALKVVGDPLAAIKAELKRFCPHLRRREFNGAKRCDACGDELRASNAPQP